MQFNDRHKLTLCIAGRHLSVTITQDNYSWMAQMPFPETNQQRFRAVSLETAKMSYPAGMSRSKNPPLRGNGEEGPKRRIVTYFERNFPLEDVWNRRVGDYENWHAALVRTIGNMLLRQGCVGQNRNSRALAAKLLNTYMHQLMKYDECRYLWNFLHLPLDRRVCDALRALGAESLAAVEEYLRLSPYELRYPRHLQIQTALLALTGELNARPAMQFQLTSRIELNWLWA